VGVRVLGINLYILEIVAIIAWFILLYFVVSGRGSSSTRARRQFYRKPFDVKKASLPDVRYSPLDVSNFPFDIKDVGQQMRAVMAASFQKRRLLNSGEYRAFKIIETDIAAARRGYRVFAQTSLGEVLTSPDESGFFSINSKRVDILIVDQGGWPVVAVEYQGEGHYQGTAAARDAVKKEALRKAGVRYVEVSASDTADQIRARVRDQLGWPAVLPTSEAVRSA
jgi:Protein of unknown function (DUF2726)